jgi:hypothetical protein
MLNSFVFSSSFTVAKLFPPTGSPSFLVGGKSLLLKSMNTKSVAIFPSVPLGQASSVTPAPHTVLGKDERLRMEDKIRQTVDGWTEGEKATAYLYLYTSGMNLDKAKTIRRKAGFVS